MISRTVTQPPGEPMEEPEETIHPDPEVVANAWVGDWRALEERAAADLEGYWAERAGELEWSRRWDTVLDESGAPFYRWFVGARTNIVSNAVDRHLTNSHRNKLALIWVGEDIEQVRTFSYFDLGREVERMANVLKAMGVGKGDVVTIYLPRIPEIFFAMLACAKLGAIHSVVFAGYSSDALSARIDDSESKVVITADGSWINGKVFPLKKIVDDAVRFSPTVQNVIVVRNTATEAVMDPIRDHWYHELCKLPIAQGRCETVQVDAEDPLFILYTSGSTGKPKAILHSHGGYQVGTYATLHDCFDVHDADRCPIIDTWWQTETGMFQITTVPSMPQKPGAAGRPVFGQEAAVVDEEGREVPDGVEGNLVLKRPWPSMMRTLFRDPQRYVDTYWSKYPGLYLTGDSAKRDADGWFWIIGRTDDVIKVSGHRLGTAEVESALVSHSAVTEAAAVGLPHEVKGHSVHVAVVLATGVEPSRELEAELRQHVAASLSPIAKPESFCFLESLPKTRSGKILRRVLRARALGQDEGDLSALAEE